MIVIERNLLALIILCVGWSDVPAQDYYDFELNPRQLKRTAQHAERQHDYYTAVSFYEQYLSHRKKDKKAVLRLAHLYREVRDYQKALHWYERAVAADPKKNVVASFYSGKMQMAVKMYPEALESFNDFRKNYRGKKYNDERRLARTLSEGCEMAMSDTIPNPNTYLDHLGNGINMAYMESAPMPANNEQFIFASLKSDTVIHYTDSEYVDTVAFRNQFYLAVKKEDGWHSKGLLKGPFNQTGYEVGNGCFDTEGDKFYFTRCKRNWKYKMICHLYVSYFKNEQWTEPELLPEPINLKQYSTTQPTMGTEPRSGNEVLYFVSDRPGGRGGTDLWYSELRKGEYREPRNCGGRINTEGNEVTPFYQLETNTLYFSSDGHPTYGQLDVFQSFGQKSKWVKNPENLGLPVNSSADDLYYILSPDPREGFFTSNREGGVVLKNPTCCDDIYAFENDENRRVEYQAVILSNHKDGTDLIEKGTVDVYLRDRESSDTTFIRSVPIQPDGTVSLDVQKNLDYLLVLKTDDHFTTSMRIPMDTGTTIGNASDTIFLERMEDRSVVLNNIYYDFDDWKLRPESEKAIEEYLLQVLLLNPKIRIEISSHTDNKGGSAYNLRLSQKRAESVVAYLRKKGIDRSRLIPKGYGQSKPIAPNNNPDGSDNPEGRQLNRRTEFKVLGN